jgi:parallel beta-helix repeat protein
MKPKIILFLFFFVVFFLGVFSTAQAATYTEIFYVSNGGDGTQTEDPGCVAAGTCWDDDDLRNSANWAAVDSDDGKIGPNDLVLIYDGGGIFYHWMGFNVGASGLPGKPITIQAAPGESPEFSAQGQSGNGWGIQVKGKDYITIDGLTASYFYYDGFRVRGECGTIPDYVMILNSTSHNNIQNGINVENWCRSDGVYLTNIRVDNNTVRDNGAYGIYFNFLIRDSTISRNVVYGNGHTPVNNMYGHHGISCRSNTYAQRVRTLTIEYNEVYDQYDNDLAFSREGTGINLDDWCSDTTVRYNYVHDNDGPGFVIHKGNNNTFYGNTVVDNGEDADWGPDSGIFLKNAYNNKIYNNVFYSNGLYGLWAYDDDGTSDNNDVQNNIFYEHSSKEIRVWTSASSNFNSNNNQFYHSAGGSYFVWDTVDKTFAQWQAVPQDQQSAEGDPGFRDISSDDFHIQATSPCRDKGTDLGSPFNIDMDGNLRGVDGAWDIGAYEYTSGSPTIPKQSDWIYQGIVLLAGPSGSWDYRLHGMISPCSVVKKDGTYFLYYIGADGDRSTDGGPRRRALGVATSTDGINFIKYSGNPIITFLPHQGSSWDEEEGVFSCGATLDENNNIILYYAAMTAIDAYSVVDDVRLAVSSNGFDFTDLGVVIDHSDSSVWGYGDELIPVGAFHANGQWYVYYIAKGVNAFWDLVLAWGPSRDNFPNTQAVLTSGSYVIGGGDPVWIETDTIAIFIVRDFNQGLIEVRTAPSSSPDQLSSPVETYDFGTNFRHATIFLDKETNTWFMYHRTKAGNEVRVRTAPVTGSSDCGNLQCDAGECSSCPGDCSLSDCCSIEGCNPGVGEDCDNCPGDCLGFGEVCCSGVVWTGDCCSDLDCSVGDQCISHACTSQSQTCFEMAGPNWDCCSGTEVCEGTSYTGASDCSGTCCSQACTTLDINSGLVAKWKFDEGSGTTASDSSGNGHTADLINNPVWTTDRFGSAGKALRFNGVDQYGETYYTDHLPNWTVSVWVKGNSPPGSNWDAGPVMKEDNFLMSWDHTWSAARGAATVAVGGGWYPASFGTLNADTWYHLAATYDGETLRTYKDGQPVSSNTDPSGDADHTSLSIKIGRHAERTEYFSGVVDEVSIWNRPLSSDEINQVFSGVYHRADLNQDGCIELAELLVFIKRWKVSSRDVTMPELMDAIGLWNAGTGCGQ